MGYLPYIDVVQCHGFNRPSSLLLNASHSVELCLMAFYIPELISRQGHDSVLINQSYHLLESQFYFPAEVWRPNDTWSGFQGLRTFDRPVSQRSRRLLFLNNSSRSSQQPLLTSKRVLESFIIHVIHFADQLSVLEGMSSSYDLTLHIVVIYLSKI